MRMKLWTRRACHGALLDRQFPSRSIAVHLNDQSIIGNRCERDRNQPYEIHAWGMSTAIPRGQPERAPRSPKATSSSPSCLSGRRCRLREYVRVSRDVFNREPWHTFVDLGIGNVGHC